MSSESESSVDYRTEDNQESSDDNPNKTTTQKTEGVFVEKQESETDHASRRGDCLRLFANIEQQFHSCKDRVYQQKVEEIEKEVQQVGDGTHPELSARMEEIEMKRAKRVSIVTGWRKVYLDSAERLWQGNLHQAHCHLLEKKAELRRHMLQDIQSKIWRMEEEKRELEESKKRTRMELELEDSFFQRRQLRHSIFADIKRICSKGGISLRVTGLRDSDIEADLKAMKSSTPSPLEAPETSPGAFSAPFKDVFVRDGGFYYKSNWINRGDKIVIHGVASGKFSGRIVAVTDMDVIVRRTDGSKTKLSLDLVKSGNIELDVK